MKLVKPLAVLTAAAMLSACASSGTSLAQRTTAPSKRITVDADKVSQVEKAAFQRNLDVVWVNPPQKIRTIRGK